MKLDYHISYLPYNWAALVEYVKALPEPVSHGLEFGELVRQRNHWHTLFYQFETNSAVCLGIDSHPETPWPVAEWYYLFWLPKSVFLSEWCRCLKRRRGAPFYFDYEQSNRGEQLMMKL